MNRRSAVKNLAVATGGLISLPFWMTACRFTDKQTHFSSFTTAEQATLAAIADTMIPAKAGVVGAMGAGVTGAGGGVGASIGALSVGVDKFLQKLIDDCYEKPIQDNVKKQLAAIETSANTAYGKDFTACSAQQKHQLVLNGLSSPDKDTKDCFTLLKSETIRGFNTSQQVMEKYLNYKVAPGHYYGSVTLQTFKP